ncbi:MAG: hypothetical protein D6715_11955 [Calditrichaeota bacterium]|nr:MAG: hypothetical protein D6715_11955 [Calditrichota bacterium]
MAEQLYRKISRIVETYIIISFVLITIVPLLNYSWVPAFVKVVYFTSFPLLILLLIASLAKDLILRLLERWLETRN